MQEKIEKYEEQYQLTPTYELAHKIARFYFRMDQETALQFLINIPEKQWRPIVNQHFKETGTWYGFLFIAAGEINYWNKFIADGAYLSEGEIEETYTYKFSKKIEVDLKIVSGNPPYVDPVLFREGHEIAVGEPADELDGDYIFETPVMVKHQDRYSGQEKSFQRDAIFHLKVIAN